MPKISAKDLEDQAAADAAPDPDLLAEAERQRQQLEKDRQEAEKQAYEDQWRDPSPPEFEIAAIEPPASDVVITEPELDLEKLATIPRPFRTAAVAQ